MSLSITDCLLATWLTSDNSNFQGKPKRFELSGVRVIRGWDWDGIPADTNLIMTHFDTFCVSKHQETKESDTKDAADTHNAAHFFKN